MKAKRRSEPVSGLPLPGKIVPIVLVTRCGEKFLGKDQNCLAPEF